MLTGCGPMTDQATGTTPGLAPEGQFLYIDNKRVHAVVQGKGPDVILLHGASGNTRDFTFDLVDRLDDRYRVIAFDRPGLGLSDPLHNRGESPQEQAAHLAKAAQALGVDRAVVVGHSYGGAVALAWAVTQPDSAAAVVSLAGAAHPWPGELGGWYALMNTRFGGGVIAPLVSAVAPRNRASSFVEGIFEPNEMPAGYVAHVGVDLSLQPRVIRSNARQVYTLKPHLRELAQHYPNLSTPIEAVHGRADETVPARYHSIPLSELAPNVRLTLLDGIGHMPHHAAPDQVVAAIDRAARRAGLR